MLTFFSVLLLTAAARSYTALRLHELIGLADLMVTGTIVEVREESVLVEIAKVGFGEPSGPRIVVRRFQNWTCAWRWTEYAVDQRCLYFLAAARTPGDPCGILGAGGEGERPLEAGEDSIKLWALGNRPIQVDDLMSEARRYREHFRFLDRLGTIERSCSEQELATYEESSKLARILSRETFSPGLFRHAGRYRDPAKPSPAPKGSVSRWDLGLGVLPTALVALPDLDRDGIDELAYAQESLWILHPRPGQEPLRERFAGDALFATGCKSLALLGDLAGDGSIELAAGDPEAAEGGFRNGAVWIFSLGQTGAVERSSKITLAEPVFGAVETAFAEFGNTLAGLGDLDGDGRKELAVSENWNTWGRGQVWILFLDAMGKPTRATRLLDEGEAPQCDLELASLGDLDQDGVDDLAMGTSKGNGLWLFFLGRDGHRRGVVDLSRSGKDSASFGASVATLGDVDGDGTIELAVGSYRTIHILSLTKEGAVQRDREIGPSGGFPDPLPDGSQFGTVLGAWPRVGRRELVAAGFSWLGPSPRQRPTQRFYPSLWVLEPVAR